MFSPTRTYSFSMFFFSEIRDVKLFLCNPIGREKKPFSFSLPLHLVARGAGFCGCRGRSVFVKLLKKKRIIPLRSIKANAMQLIQRRYSTKPSTVRRQPTFGRAERCSTRLLFFSCFVSFFILFLTSSRQLL